MVHVRPRFFDHQVAEFAGARHWRLPNQRRSLRHQNQKQSRLGLMRGEMFGGELMLAFTGRTVHDGDVILFCPGPQTSANPPRHAHQMRIVEPLQQLT